MEEDWAPLLSKDCMLFTPGGFSLEDDFQLTSLEYGPVDKPIKKEPVDETSGQFHCVAAFCSSANVSYHPVVVTRS